MFVGGKHKKKKREKNTCAIHWNLPLQDCLQVLWVAFLCLYTSTPMYPHSMLLLSVSPFLWQMEEGWWAGLGSASPLVHRRRRQQPQGLESERRPSTRPLSWVWPPLPCPLRGERETTEGTLEVWMYRAFNRTCYITAVNQRWSGGGNIWQMKLRLSPPMEKEPSSLLCMTRLSTWRVIGEGSESEGLSRGPSSCSRGDKCWAWGYKFWFVWACVCVCVCVCVRAGNYPHPGFHISSTENLLTREETQERRQKGLSMSLNIQFKSKFQLGHGSKYLTWL